MVASAVAVATMPLEFNQAMQDDTLASLKAPFERRAAGF